MDTIPYTSLTPGAQIVCTTADLLCLNQYQTYEVKQDRFGIYVNCCRDRHYFAEPASGLVEGFVMTVQGS